MKNLFLIICIVFVLGYKIYPGEHTISLGFQAPFTLMTGESTKVVSSNVNIADLVDVNYDKFIYSLGANIKGKFTGYSGWGGMFKTYFFFPYRMKNDITVSTRLLGGSSENEYTDFDPAVIFGTGGGVVKRFYLNEIFCIAMDLGLELQLDVIEVDLYNLLMLNFGIFSGVMFEYHINKHLFMDAGINYDILFGSGIYSYPKSDIKVTTGEIGFAILPSISIGYKF